MKERKKRKARPFLWGKKNEKENEKNLFFTPTSPPPERARVFPFFLSLFIYIERERHSAAAPSELQYFSFFLSTVLSFHLP